MLKRIKYILIALALISLVLGTTGCIIYSPGSSPSPPPTSSPPGNSSEYPNPDWTSPPGNSHTAQPLPDITSVISEVMPSVVSVTTEMIVRDIFNREYTESAAGSGVIIDNEGYIVTNNHVVQNAKRVQVELTDGRTFPANIVGTDALTDLAVLKIDATDLSYAQLGDSSQLSVGNWAIAIGNALGEGITATHGIISRLNVSIIVSGNTFRGLIQTDAAINPGNSGGPLVNIAGEVIGITSVKMAAVGIEGMGYAISINSAEPIISDLIHQGYVIRPWLGVGLYTVTPDVAARDHLSVNEGAIIVELTPGSPADNAGLEEDDIIILFDNREITNVDDLLQAIHDSQIGQRVEIVFVRGEETKTAWAILEESPPPWD